MPSTTDHRAEGQDTWAASHAFWWLLLAGSLAGALGEATLILGARIALHRYTLFNPQGIWMAPLANLLLLVVPLGLVALVARRPVSFDLVVHRRRRTPCSTCRRVPFALKQGSDPSPNHGGDAV